MRFSPLQKEIKLRNQSEILQIMEEWATVGSGYQGGGKELKGPPELFRGGVASELPKCGHTVREECYGTAAKFE